MHGKLSRGVHTGLNPGLLKVGSAVQFGVKPLVLVWLGVSWGEEGFPKGSAGDL